MSNAGIVFADDDSFHWERVALRYVKGWPERSPRPYRLFHNNEYVSAHASLASLVRAAMRRRDREA